MVMVVRKRCYIIAEAGVNHNGNLQTALDMIDIASEAGADAIKFQTFIPEKLVTATAEAVTYQRNNMGAKDQLSMLKSLVLERDHHPILMQRCKEKSINFLSTAFDESSADFLFELGIDCIKIPSGEVTNLPFIEYLANMALPIILSTGMSTLDEVHRAVKLITGIKKKQVNEESKLSDLTVLHCTSNYPTEYKDVNLLAMKTMGASLDLPVGYSDHTLSTLISPVAVGMGASVIEKHFTLNRGQSGPDHAASLEPSELAVMISAIREVELSLGDGIKAPRDSELEVRDLVRRSITSRCDLEPGVRISSTDIQFLRPGTGIPPHEVSKVIGKIVKKKIKTGVTLEWADFE